MLADLHVHTQASDGVYSPEEVCHFAIQSGLGAIAITDHDTMDGFLKLKIPVPGLEVIPGVEISTTWEKLDLHILGYHVSLEKGSLEEKLINFRSERQRRIARMVEKATNLGFPVTVNEAEAFAQGDSIGRPHLARALVARGYFDDEKTVFAELLANGAPAYVPREKLSPEEGIKAILSSGGVPVLAHPGLYPEVIKIISELVSYGLKGIEVYYPLHSQEFINVLLKIAKPYGLIVTGGSDFHGVPGDSLGNAGVDMETVRLIKEASG